MKSRPWLRSVLRMATICFVLYVAFALFLFSFQRSLLFFPSNHDVFSQLDRWDHEGATIGYCRLVKDPEAVWLMLHGNAGQAADRDYVLPRLSEKHSLFVLEYPGYGSRPGTPSRQSFDKAAAEAYRQLRSQYPDTPVCVLGESIGSGPACSLAEQSLPPDKIVLVVPFDSLARVAANRFFFLPVNWLLRDNWNNTNALNDFAGPIEIFGATQDKIIPLKHAKALADQLPNAEFIPVECAHNDWSWCSQIAIDL